MHWEFYISQGFFKFIQGTFFRNYGKISNEKKSHGREITTVKCTRSIFLGYRLGILQLHNTVKKQTSDNNKLINYLVIKF